MVTPSFTVVGVTPVAGEFDAWPALPAVPPVVPPGAVAFFVLLAHPTKSKVNSRRDAIPRLRSARTGTPFPGDRRV
jgi:hypothetical protein